MVWWCIVPCPILDTLTIGIAILMCVTKYYNSTTHYINLKAKSNRSIKSGRWNIIRKYLIFKNIL